MLTGKRTPKTYLSVSTGAGGRRLWRCIHQGLPLCADSDIADNSIAQFRHVLKWPTGYSLGPIPVYDGDTDEWTTWPTNRTGQPRQ